MRSTGSAGYDLTARFDHIDGLTLGSDVKIAGVKVGSVTEQSIDPKTFQAIVGVRIDGAIKLPKDSSAEIVSDGLLGGKYLSLTPGGEDDNLKPGGRISITQSAGTPPPPSRRRPDARISPAMERVILRALAKDPNDRPQTADAFRAELVAVVDDATAYGEGLANEVEKSLKAAATGLPFVTVGAPRAVERLSELGFQTFGGLIDHHYDLVPDPAERLPLVYVQSRGNRDGPCGRPPTARDPSQHPARPRRRGWPDRT